MFYWLRCYMNFTIMWNTKHTDKGLSYAVTRNKTRIALMLGSYTGAMSKTTWHSDNEYATIVLHLHRSASLNEISWTDFKCICTVM